MSPDPSILRDLVGPASPARSRARLALLEWARQPYTRRGADVFISALGVPCTRATCIRTWTEQARKGTTPGECTVADRYKIVRSYFEGGTRTIARGLTLDEAQAHCRHLETSSRTATSSAARKRTLARGPWFDGYERE